MRVKILKGGVIEVKSAGHGVGPCPSIKIITVITLIVVLIFAMLILSLKLERKRQPIVIPDDADLVLV